MKEAKLLNRVQAVIPHTIILLLAAIQESSLKMSLPVIYETILVQVRIPPQRYPRAMRKKNLARFSLSYADLR
jgi:hypothetical protein